MVNAKATSVHRLSEKGGERASWSISHMRESKLKTGPKFTKTEVNPFLLQGRLGKATQQELGNDIQTGEHSRVRLFRFSSYRRYL